MKATMNEVAETKKEAEKQGINVDISPLSIPMKTIQEEKPNEGGSSAPQNRHLARAKPVHTGPMGGKIISSNPKKKGGIYENRIRG